MKIITLTKNKVAKVSDEDFGWISQHPWYALQAKGGQWYAVRDVGPRGSVVTLLMHREINKTPKGLDTDHKNGDTLDNQRYNLRDATRTQNCHNSRKRTGTSSAYKGGYLHWSRGPRGPRSYSCWVARIKINSGSRHLGCFETEVEAAQAYDAAAKVHFGDFARPNFV
jgi:hypothetical protein